MDPNQTSLIVVHTVCNASAMIMAGALSVNPVRPSVLYVRTYVPIHVRSLTGIFLSEFYETWSHCLVP